MERFERSHFVSNLLPLLRFTKNSNMPARQTRCGEDGKQHGGNNEKKEDASLGKDDVLDRVPERNEADSTHPCHHSQKEKCRPVPS